MSRRHLIILGIVLGGVKPALAGEWFSFLFGKHKSTELDPQLWAQYRARFVTADGRVIDSDNDPKGITHTEGLGFGMLLAEATERAAAGTDVIVRRLRCLANCTGGPSAAMRCNGSWTYIFGGLDAADAGALVEGATLLAGATLTHAPTHRHAYLAPSQGAVLVNGQRVAIGDGIAATDELELTITAEENAELVLVDAA